MNYYANKSRRIRWSLQPMAFIFWLLLTWPVCVQASAPSTAAGIDSIGGTAGDENGARSTPNQYEDLGSLSQDLENVKHTGDPIIGHETTELHEDQGNHTVPHEKHTYHVASLNYETVQTPLAIAIWIFIATIAKIGFHMANKLSKIFPESILLIVLGIAIGLLLFYTHLMTVSPLTPFTFFMFLLPPIVLDAGYFMPNRSFFDNLGTILLFAVIGTIWNTVAIGVSLWAVGLTGLYGLELNILESFLFSALISAVDPVAVLAVFEEIQVNEVLYIVVFGESLLNDAVTVVLYHMFEAYTEMGESNVGYSDVLLGFLSFFVVACGGTAIGIVWGFLTGFVSRFTDHVRVVEPLIVFVMAYLSHLTAELFHLSGILAVTFCGICSKNYVEANISMKSRTTLKYAMKMLSSVSETIIFLFLGVSIVNDEHDWNTWFVIFTVLFCTVYRAIGVVVLTSMANHFRVHKLNKVEEFVMAYGGLRGAVAFALALTIDQRVVSHKSMFVTATIAMVFFTVFFQGITIKPLVQLLRVKQSEKRKKTMNERIHERLMDHLMAAIEELVGNPSNIYIREKFKYYDHHYIRRWLVRDHQAKEPKILETFSKLNVRDAKEYLMQNGTVMQSSSIGNELSLAAIFRNYTQTNLEGLKSGSSQFSLAENNISTCTLDMQELDYSPSTKDLNDVRMHHILKDSMFQAPKRHRRFSRTVIDDEDFHPPFKHMVRMQIRHMLSEQHRQKKGKKKHGTPDNGLNNIKFNNLAIGDNFSKNGNKDKSGYSYFNQAMDDEDGITFTARVSNKGEDNVINRKVVKPPSPPLPRTMTEAQLPWRRLDEGVDDLPLDDHPIIQQEFPFWVGNKEYNPYVSPTTTFLNRLDTRDMRPVYHIFEETSEEMAGNESPSSSAGSPSNHTRSTVRISSDSSSTSSAVNESSNNKSSEKHTTQL
ncbi:Sodium hydrogen exchanger, variant 2 [Chamberlinius hualienensis]